MFFWLLVTTYPLLFVKVHIFWEGHKILRNLHRRFDRYYMGQIYGGYFSKFCGLLRIYELYGICESSLNLTTKLSNLQVSLLDRLKVEWPSAMPMYKIPKTILPSSVTAPMEWQMDSKTFMLSTILHFIQFMVTHFDIVRGSPLVPFQLVRSPV